MGKKIKEITWPQGGLDKRWGYEQQPPYSTPDCLNVYPTDVIETRGRGGSRPGLIKAYPQLLGSGNPIRMLSSVTTAGPNLERTWSDNFGGSSIGSDWTAASWKADGLPPILPSNVAASDTTKDSVGAVYNGSVIPASTSSYTLEIFIQPWNGEHHGTYEIYGRMNTSSPDATNVGFVAALVLSGSTGAYSGTLTFYAAGVPTVHTFTPGSSGLSQAGWFSVVVTGSTVACYWAGATLQSQTISGVTNHKFGFGMTCTNAGGYCLISTFRVKYQQTTGEYSRRTQLIASANGLIYREEPSGTMAAVSTSLTLASNKRLLGIERYQKVYIADYGSVLASGTDGAVSSSQLSSASISDWTTLGLNANDFVVVIISASGSTVAGTYAISSINSGYLALTTNPGDGTNAVFSVERAPKIYDPVANTVSLWTATSGKGQVPTGSGILARYRDRLVFAKDHIVYMSRSGDPLDWDYSQTDAQRAVALQATSTGYVGEKVTAICVLRDDYMLIGCLNSTWMLRGDPAYSGGLDAISQVVGPIDAGSVCASPDGIIFMLTRDGIYSASPQGVTAISREKLPRELVNLDPSNVEIQMVYDVENVGIHIYVTSTTNMKHFWFDYRNKGFWPVTLQTAHQPHSIIYYKADDQAGTGVLLGCHDGYIRKFSKGQPNDDGVAFESYVTFGPIKTSSSDIFDGRIDEMNFTMDSVSGAVAMQVQSSDTPQESIGQTSPFFVQNLIAGMNYKIRPRVRGNNPVVRLTGLGASWAFEGLAIVTSQLGKHRKMP